jgi:4-hydroxy-4-methyl-2-oxoglutarate aldolase
VIDDAALLVQLESLYTAVVADVLDGLGYRDQVLPAHIRPLTPARRVCGVVFPAKAVSVTEIPAEPYKLEIGAIEAMQRGDVLLIDAGDERSCGFWGELLTTACLYKGVRGVVMTACTRDTWRIFEMPLPIFGIGYHPGDSKGRADIIEIGQPITIGDVQAQRGDFILGDEDGIVVIPRAIAAEAIRLATEKLAGENLVREDLQRGMPLGEAFRKHQIL